MRAYYDKEWNSVTITNTNHFDFMENSWTLNNNETIRLIDELNKALEQKRTIYQKMKPKNQGQVCIMCGAIMIESNEAEMYCTPIELGSGSPWNYCPKCGNNCIYDIEGWIWESEVSKENSSD